VSRVVVIGATGHVGTYLVPRLVRAGYEVVALSRGGTQAVPVGAEHAGVTRDHVGRSIAASIDRAREILGYRPRYSSLDALHESLRWLAANGRVDVGRRDF
jgi:nucleoside-diphosphate-sugar epimerase